MYKFKTYIYDFWYIDMFEKCFINLIFPLIKVNTYRADICLSLKEVYKFYNEFPVQ